MPNSDTYDVIAQTVQHQIDKYNQLTDLIKYQSESGRTVYKEQNKLASLKLQIMKDISALQKRGYKFNSIPEDL